MRPPKIAPAVGVARASSEILGENADPDAMDETAFRKAVVHDLTQIYGLLDAIAKRLDMA